MYIVYIVLAKTTLRSANNTSFKKKTCDWSASSSEEESILKTFYIGQWSQEV